MTKQEASIRLLKNGIKDNIDALMYYTALRSVDTLFTDLPTFQNIVETISDNEYTVDLVSLGFGIQKVAIIKNEYYPEYWE